MNKRDTHGMASWHITAYITWERWERSWHGIDLLAPGAFTSSGSGDMGDAGREVSKVLWCTGGSAGSPCPVAPRVAAEARVREAEHAFPAGHGGARELRRALFTVATVRRNLRASLGTRESRARASGVKVF